MRDAEFVKIARALADPTRHRMLREIRDAGELNCSQVCGRFDLKQPTISHHIRLLAEAGLIRCRREGPYHVMAVEEAVLAEFARSVAGGGRGRSGTRARKAPAGRGGRRG